ncbi:MAG: transcriptional regulator [Firmicutes bacterium]|nr:transcriptional regulator [Bacillota bacterium]
MISEFDKKLLNIIQGDLPLSKRPFALVAKRLGAKESFVLERLNSLKAEGYIRRLGAFFDSERLGYKGTLVALAVEPDMVAAVAEVINSYPGVTHNYERDGSYNLWITLLSLNAEEEEGIISAISAIPGVNRLLNLPASEKFKVNVQFNLE